MRSVATAIGLDIAGFDMIEATHSQAAAEKAVELVRSGKADLLMKGSLHSDELLGAVTKRDTGLRTGRRISHVFVMDVPTHSETLFITDAAVNIAPDLLAKRDIIQNAIDLYAGLGLGTPKVAILSAVETVTPNIPSTIEAAALCKMADRGQITGGELDGPLAFDNAISPEAARIKGISSPVAGRRRNPGRTGSRSRQHARQEPDVSFRRRRGRHRARCTSSHHTNLARRQGQDPNGIGCSGNAARLQPTGKGPCSGMTDMDNVLVINAGSSSVKFQLFGIPAHDQLELRVKGQVDGIGTRPRLLARNTEGATLIDAAARPAEVATVSAALERALLFLREKTGGKLPSAIGHRVVHGGPDYKAADDRHRNRAQSP